jgi:hypothetical protein
MAVVLASAYVRLMGDSAILSPFIDVPEVDWRGSDDVGLGGRARARPRRPGEERARRPERLSGPG